MKQHMAVKTPAKPLSNEQENCFHFVLTIFEAELFH